MLRGSSGRERRAKLLGTAIAHLLATGKPMSETKAAQLAEVIVHGMRRA